ncbi:MAG: glycosyltransferase [Planctomycetes bacterium]|nr:glycosyltransferase [Planctomycetota bacterium]
MVVKVARILGRGNVGGPARTALELSRRLAGRGYETLLLAGEPERTEGDLLAGVDDVTVRVMPGFRRRPGLGDLGAQRRLRAALREFRPDIVHTHAAKAGALGRLASRSLRPRPRLVHTFHGHVLDGYFPRPLSALFAAVERRLALTTDALVAVSEAVARELAERHRVAPRERFRVIENGIDLASFRAAGARSRGAARERLGCSPAALVLLVPARLVPIKGHAVLFDALRLLSPALLPLEVHLLGDGPLRRRLERAAARLREGFVVRFHGFRDDLPAVLPAGDVVVLPSKSEGMPLALMDAMACGVPVVATAVGGVPELLDQGAAGLLAAPRDAASLARALERVLGDIEFARGVARAGRKRVEERHTIERVVEEHARLYAELLA